MLSLKRELFLCGSLLHDQRTAATIYLRNRFPNCYGVKLLSMLEGFNERLAFACHFLAKFDRA